MSGLRKRVARVVATAITVDDDRIKATIALTADSRAVFEVTETDADPAWIAGVLDAFGVESWEQLATRTAYVLRREAAGPVVGFDHLATEPGGRFMFPDVGAIEEETGDE